MKRPMLRLHNPHLKNKIRGLRNTNVQCIRLESNANTNPGAAPFSRVLQRYIGNVLSPMHLWEAMVNLVTICLEWRQ
ncbi:unnamed protein product [Brassica napus]|uniref:(rape) hypothetical protein n=1 Tax=Brassica napus TaxID=3708 RepID=A0A816JMZ1_BRANA|nr:unnamed protein product [Brassica napus]